MEEIVKYGVAIKGTNVPIGFSYCVGGDDFCTDIEHKFDETEDNVWLVNTKEEAKKAIETKPEWYNAYHSSPLHIKGKELEVVKITFKVEKVEE